MKEHTPNVSVLLSVGLLYMNSYLFCIFLQATMDLANKHASDPAALKVIFSSLVLICKIFYSLNFQVRYLVLMVPHDIY